ncbi:MAG: hypothetical protein J1E37_08860 [Prevotella sp.]|nr:hypothetical protein [Prevotella sp.]
MAGWDNQKFAMPMFNSWVPEWLRPWLYVLFALLFQLSGGIYFGNLQQMMGATSLMREDLQMVAMFGVVGVNMPFPFLFRFKLRFTNRQLLINAALVIAACNVLCLYVTWLPALCVLSYVAGFFKLCGTFECFSNIRLWISPKEDFGVFLPTMYIIILAAMPASGWAAQYLTATLGSWQMVHWLMTAAMLTVVLLVYTLTHPWRFMRPLPLVSLDWLGCGLWSAVMLEVIWLFTYGEYYNWSDSATWSAVLACTPVTLALAINRMRRIRHPYIAPSVWHRPLLLPILGMFFVAELMNATPHALQNTLTGGILHWGYTTTQQFYAFELAGYALGAAFTIFWHRPLRLGYTHLLTVGFLCLLAYQVLMYFYVSPSLNMERLCLPTFLRTFGYAIFFSALTICLKNFYEFPIFFMALTVSGFIRNGVAESLCSGLYSYSLHRQIADTLSRGLHPDFQGVLQVSVKEVWGAVCIIGTVLLLLLLLFSLLRSRLLTPHEKPVYP